jgi:hypothetical protein
MDEILHSETIDEAASRIANQLRSLGRELTEAELYAYKIGFYDGWNRIVVDNEA